MIRYSSRTHMNRDPAVIYPPGQTAAHSTCGKLWSGTGQLPVVRATSTITVRAASGARLSRSCLQQVDRYFGVGLERYLVPIDDDRLTTVFRTRQYERRGGVIGKHRHGVAMPLEPEVHSLPVRREPRLEGHLAVPHPESAESADDRLPGSACGRYVNALAGVALVVDEIDECRPAEVLVGDPQRAVQYFRRSAFVDLIDNQGNTSEGIHIASAGGTWQTIVCGFGGFRVRNGQMTFKPWLPPDWKAVDFRLKWHGNTVSVFADHTSATFVLSGPKDRRETIIVNGHEITLQANTKVTVDLLQARPRQPGA